MRGLIATTAVAIAAAVGSGVDAATCTNSQVQYIYQLYQSAASYSGCSPYAKYDTSGITISWTCSSTSCIPMMQALADKLPSCEYASNGVNNKVNLLKALYTTCRVCTDAQQATITSLWKQAAATSSCSPYSSSSGSSTSFSWPCSATGCTAVLKDLASKVPDCYTNGVNEKTRILSPVSTCSSVNPSPATPSPSKTSTSGSTSTPSTASPSYGGSGGTCTDAQAAASSALWEAAAATSACSPYASKTFDLISISWPCRVTSCTAVMETLGESLPDCVLSGNTKSEKQSVQDAVKYCESGGTSGGDSDTTTTAPSPTYDSGYYSTDACSIAETAETVDLYYDVATSDECKSYATITTYRIYISAPCTSSCVTVGFQKLATNLDDCYYEYDGENKKKQVNNELQSKCSPKSGRKLLGDVSEASYVTVEYTTKTAISKGTTKPPSSSVSPGKTSGAVAHVAATSSAVVLATAAMLAL